MHSASYELVYYQTAVDFIPFKQWLYGIPDPNSAARIDIRLGRLRLGNFGDAKPLLGGIWELRFHFGPGYRVYFAREGSSILLLLAGGTKGSQQRDIRKARAYYADYKERQSRP